MPPTPLVGTIAGRGQRRKFVVTQDANRQEWAAAFQRASWGCAPAIGRALGLSTRAIEQWGSADSGKRSPGERLQILIATALEHRKPHDALAPLHLLAERFGYALAPSAAVADARPAGQDLNRSTAAVLLPRQRTGCFGSGEYRSGRNRSTQHHPPPVVDIVRDVAEDGDRTKQASSGGALRRPRREFYLSIR